MTDLPKRLCRWALATVLVASGPAWPALGGDAASVQADRAAMNGSMKNTAASQYDVYEIGLESGTIIREYVSPDGRVFAVVWDGPALPDFNQVLGSYFAQLTRENAGSGVGPLVIQQPGLVLYSSGHMRAFHGRAYVPALVPAGLNLEQIR